MIHTFLNVLLLVLKPGVCFTFMRGSNISQCGSHYCHWEPQMTAMKPSQNSIQFFILMCCIKAKWPITDTAKNRLINTTKITINYNKDNIIMLHKGKLVHKRLLTQKKFLWNMFKHKQMFTKYVNIFAHGICSWCTSSGGMTFVWRTNIKKKRKISIFFRRNVISNGFE
jgi:hypothetical protein